MNCPTCGFESPPRTRFCGNCGNPLTILCAACGAEMPARFRFCGDCGSPLAAANRNAVGEASRLPTDAAERRGYDVEEASRLPEEAAGRRGYSTVFGEHKQVTVLFADVKGSMELAESVDPEAWHAIIDRFFAILADGIHRCEGTITHYAGDGVMALFGAPVALEDHAERACQAALELADELRRYGDELRLNEGINFAVRVGLNSGDVVVGSIGDDLRMEYTALGNTVGLAARMEQIAEPGRIYLTAHTARLVAGRFELRDLGPLAVKGIHEPVQVYELTGVGPLRNRLEVARSRGFSRLVGRETEMVELGGALTAAIGGAPQIVGIVADAGMGKSRLCYEFAQRCRTDGISVHEAHVLPQGRALPLQAILSLLRSYFGIAEEDDDRTARDRIAGRVVLLDPGLVESLPLVFDFLGVPDPKQPAPKLEPKERLRRLTGIVRRMTSARSEREPALFVVEDMQWIDPASEYLLQSLVEAIAGSRTLLLFNYRPEYEDRWIYSQGHCRAQRLALSPLAPAAVGEMVADLLGTHPSLAGLSTLVGQHTAGNPFFIEEVAQSLIERGVLTKVRSAAEPARKGRASYALTRPLMEIEIPPSVHALLAARIDRLPDWQKRVLQTAAVAGKRFSAPLLAHVLTDGGANPLLAAQLEEGLRALVEGEFLYREAARADQEYVFKHPLTHEVAYQSQLREHRSRLHGAVARAIVSLHPDRLDERAALLADHWEAAGEALESVRCHARAARRAEVRDLGEAQMHWRQVRRLAAGLSPGKEIDRLTLEACARVLDLGWRLGLPSEEADALYVQGQTLARRTNDQAVLADLRNAYARVQWVAGRAAEALVGHEDAMAFAEAAGDLNLQLTMAAEQIVTALSSGRIREGLARAEPATKLLRATPELCATSGGLLFIGFRALALMTAGELGEAHAEAKRALSLARSVENLEVSTFALAWVAETALAIGDTATALANARQSLDLANELGSLLSIVIGAWVGGAAHVLAGDYRTARPILEDALRRARDNGVGIQFEAALLTTLADALRGMGETERAIPLLEEAVVIARRRIDPISQFRALVVLAETRLDRDGVNATESVEAMLKKADEICRETEIRGWQPLLYLAQARLAGHRGDASARAERLREALQAYTAIGAAPHAARVEALLAAEGAP